MLTNRITDLSEQEILDMELEDLANMFLSDFSKILNEAKGGSYQLDNFLGIISNRVSFDVRRALSEAFQWLYNNGYIMQVLNVPSSQNYFITRAGKKRLDQHQVLSLQLDAN